MSRTWLLLLVLCAGVLTLVDALMLGRGTDVFWGGFLVVDPLHTPARLGGFVLVSLIFDLALVLGSLLVVVPLLERLRLSPRQTLAAAALCALAPALAFVYVRWKLSQFLGDLLDPSLLLALAGGTPTEWLAQGSAQLLPVAGALGATLVVGVLLVRALRAGRNGAGARALLAPPSPRALALGFALALASAAALLPPICMRGGSACYALGKKPSGVAISTLVQKLTDFDLDGYGLVVPPFDPAPFASSRHPFALDVPGNDIDENGLAGDHPADAVAIEDDFVESPRFALRPDVLLVFLEGMRGDTIGARFGEREITPFLNGLAAEGASSARAYANAPYTALSRAQLVGGRLAPFRGQSTLIDDFHANGYEVAWFSGQDESFGARESAMLGLERTDVHYDARQDAARSVSRYRTSGSLNISWKLLNERVREYLARRDPSRPLLLYVNYGDTHFPYDHAELDDVLGAPRIAREEIQPGSRARVFATYANAAANVDRALAELVTELRAREPERPLAVLVTSDHGEALFEDGVLGHGLALDDAQTRVPLVLAGVGGDWPEPIGLADVRGALQRALIAGDAAPPRFAPVPGRRILQFMAEVTEPRLLALRGADTVLRYDTADPPPEAEPEFVELVRRWEALQAQVLRRGRD